MSDADSFFVAASVQSFKFETIGDAITGFVFAPPELRQQTDFKTGEPLTWKDGSPRMQMRVLLKTDLQDDEDDDGIRAIYVKGNMQRAIAAALKKAGERSLGVGDKVQVKFEGEGEAPAKGLSKPKIFSAKYRKTERSEPVTPVAEDEFTAEDESDLAAIAGQPKPNGSAPAQPRAAEQIPF